MLTTHKLVSCVIAGLLILTQARSSSAVPVMFSRTLAVGGSAAVSARPSPAIGLVLRNSEPAQSMANGYPYGTGYYAWSLGPIDGTAADQRAFAALPATPATPAQPGGNGSRAIPAQPAVPATPAIHTGSTKPGLLNPRPLARPGGPNPGFSESPPPTKPDHPEHPAHPGSPGHGHDGEEGCGGGGGQGEGGGGGQGEGGCGGYGTGGSLGSGGNPTGGEVPEPGTFGLFFAAAYAAIILGRRPRS